MAQRPCKGAEKKRVKRLGLAFVSGELLLDGDGGGELSAAPLASDRCPKEEFIPIIPPGRSLVTRRVFFLFILALLTGSLAFISVFFFKYYCGGDLHKGHTTTNVSVEDRSLF